MSLTLKTSKRSTKGKRSIHRQAFFSHFVKMALIKRSLSFITILGLSLIGLVLSEASNNNTLTCLFAEIWNRTTFFLVP